MKMTCFTRASNSSKREGTVIQGGGKAEPVLHKGFFPGAVAVVHSAELGHGLVGFIDDHKEIGREVIEEGPRRLAGLSAIEVAGIVLDPRAIAHFPKHFQIEAGALLKPLGL
jgi:hypothetical protein